MGATPKPNADDSFTSPMETAWGGYGLRNSSHVCVGDLCGRYTGPSACLCGLLGCYAVASVLAVHASDKGRTIYAPLSIKQGKPEQMVRLGCKR